MPRSSRVLTASLALSLAAACAPQASSGGTESTEASASTEATTSNTTSTDTGTTAGYDGCPDIPCDVDEYCTWGARSCGAGWPRSDDEALCRPRPSASECDDTETPVCGCDGQVYASECLAAAAGVDLDANAGCTAPPGTVACSYGFCDPGASYCRIILVDPPEPDISSCAAFPPGCSDPPSCECILEAESCPWTSCYDYGSHHVTQCPQG